MRASTPEEHGGSGTVGFIDRPRLYRILDGRDLRVCVVQAPTGSGKTALLKGWIRSHRREETVLWLSLSDAVRSRLAFWQQVTVAAARLGLISEKDADQATARLRAGVDPVRIAAALLEDTGPVTMVFDSWEHLREAMSVVDADLLRLLAECSELRVVIASRAITSMMRADTVGWGVLGESIAITLRELVFDVDEIRQLIRVRAGVDDPRLASAVAQATRGLPFVVGSVVLALAQRGAVPTLGSTDWDAVVAARLESLLPETVPGAFVADVAVPPFVDAGLAHRLTGHPRPVELLNALERLGFGYWIPYAARRAVFQFVEAVRAAFRSRGREDPARLRRLLSETARWLVDNGESGHALSFAVQAEDFALAEGIFVSLVVTDPETYITPRYLPVLRQVPEEALPWHPMLAFGLGLALAANAAQRLEAPRIFRIAATPTPSPSPTESAVDRFTTAGMHAVAHRLAFDFETSAEASAEAIGLLDDADPAVLREYGEHVSTIVRQLAYSMFQGGRVDAALHALTRYMPLFVSEAARNYSLEYVAGFQALAGDLRAARRVYDTVDRGEWVEELRRGYLGSMGAIMRAEEALEGGRYRDGLHLVDDASKSAPLAEFWPFFTALSVRARTRLGEGGPEVRRVLRELDGATPPGFGDNLGSDLLHSALVHGLRAAGRVPQAVALIEPLRESPHLAAARIAVLLDTGRAEEALDGAESALRLRGHTIRSQAQTHTFGAAAALRAGRPDLAGEWLDEAAVAWEVYGVRDHVFDLAAPDLGALRKARSSATAQRYLSTTDVPALRREAAAVVLSARELVVLEAFTRYGNVRDVAEHLVVSPHTVKNQLQGIYRKLGVSSRGAALERAHELGLLSD